MPIKPHRKNKILHTDAELGYYARMESLEELNRKGPLVPVKSISKEITLLDFDPLKEMVNIAKNSTSEFLRFKATSQIFQLAFREALKGKEEKQDAPVLCFQIEQTQK